MTMLRETTLLLQMLNPQQLMQVRQLISSMVSSSSSSSSSGNDNHHTETAVGGTSFDSHADKSVSQDRQRQINAAFGELVPMQSLLPSTSGPQFSMRQHHTTSGPYPVPSAPAAPAQYLPSESQQDHVAGPTGSTHTSPDATLPLSPPPPVAALASPALPVVEKEGNPFDL